MLYSEFHIKNFKGIKDLQFNFGGSTSRVHTLVGLNESGKTTVLEAIDAFSMSEEDLGADEVSGRASRDEHSLIPVSRRANFTGEVEIAVSIELTERDVIELTSLLKKRAYTLSNISKSFQIRDVYSYRDSKFESRTAWWTGFTGTGRTSGQRKDHAFTKAQAPLAWTEATKFVRAKAPAVWYFPNFLFDFPERIFLEAQEGESATDAFYRSILQDMLDLLGNDTNVETHLRDRAVSGESADRTSLDNLVLAMGRHMGALVFDAWRTTLRRQTAMGLDLRVGYGEPEAPDPANRRPYVEFRIVDQDGYFSVAERSLGFRWFSFFFY